MPILHFLAWCVLASQCKMAAVFPANQVIVVGGGLAGMSAANQVVECGGPLWQDYSPFVPPPISIRHLRGQARVGMYVLAPKSSDFTHPILPMYTRVLLPQ